MENQSTADHWFFFSEPFPNFAFVTKWQNLIGPLKLTAYKPKWYAWKFSERFIYRVRVTNNQSMHIFAVAGGNHQNASFYSPSIAWNFHVISLRYTEDAWNIAHTDWLTDKVKNLKRFCLPLQKLSTLPLRIFGEESK